MTNENDNNNPIETTLGDLICAIADAAEEASIEESDVARCTQVVLNHLLERVRQDTTHQFHHFPTLGPE